MRRLKRCIAAGPFELLLYGGISLEEVEIRGKD
jgi:hypothetical protein